MISINSNGLTTLFTSSKSFSAVTIDSICNLESIETAEVSSVSKVTYNGMLPPFTSVTFSELTATIVESL